MTNKHELIKLYHRGKEIIICLASWESFKKGVVDSLEHRLNGQWIDLIPPVPDYKNYSHGLCPNCFEAYHKNKRLRQ